MGRLESGPAIEASGFGRAHSASKAVSSSSWLQSSLKIMLGSSRRIHLLLTPVIIFVDAVRIIARKGIAIGHIM
jgi:hypothetical protein